MREISWDLSKLGEAGGNIIKNIPKTNVQECSEVQSQFFYQNI